MSAIHRKGNGLIFPYQEAGFARQRTEKNNSGTPVGSLGRVLFSIQQCRQPWKWINQRNGGVAGVAMFSDVAQDDPNGP